MVIPRRTQLALICLIAAPLLVCATPLTVKSQPPQFTIADSRGDLLLRLNVESGCVLDQVRVRGRDVLNSADGVYTGIQVSNRLATTKSLLRAPSVKVSRGQLTVSGIRYATGGIEVEEAWRFLSGPNGIEWQIKRKYLTGGTLQETLLPCWNFQSMSTWTGAMLDNGGVAWNRYLETPNATLATHAGAITLWNPERNDCLRITPVVPLLGRPAAPQLSTQVKFSRQPSGTHTVAFAVTAEELKANHDLRRFHASRQDLWAPFNVAPGETTVTYVLSALDYNAAYDRGTFRGLDGASVRELLNTIGRYGVVDRRIVGANGWRTGFKCLHEQWFSQMGIALADPDYLANCAATYDYEREHAIQSDGRVKSRWWYVAGDAMPGSYDKLGYYEAQWGYLMDSQPAFVICVAELFDLTGDLAWLRRQQASCERVLEFLLKRDADNDGLLEMLNGSHLDQRGSDWIDIIWAAHENALVNAEMYHALRLWADVEELLGDQSHASAYRQSAAKLKSAFNKDLAQGGFWDPANKWYVYWRDKDDSIHGNNLVTPVNFAAISYGLCDEPARSAAILNRMETEMQKENLFFWPLNFFPYAREEGHQNNFPYPNYENGDIFLSWGELAVRAYAQTSPDVAVKYIKRTLDQYRRDGLSFQRYHRGDQTGVGDDILAGNCMPIIGLYRDIYGIQPKHNRLYLEPHITPDLNGTRLNYPLRGERFEVQLATTATTASCSGFTLSIRGRSAYGLRRTRATSTLASAARQPCP